MKTYFDIVKLVFFVLTIFVALFQLRIKGVISSSFLDGIWPFILPVYFVFVGLIIWYIIWYIVDLSHDNKQTEKDYILWFIIWAVLWVILAFIYYSFVNA